MCVYLNSKVFLMEESCRRYPENPLYLQENAAFGKLFDGFQANYMNFLSFLLKANKKGQGNPSTYSLTSRIYPVI